MEDTLFPIFMVVWVVLGIAGYAFFMFGPDAGLKRRMLPRFYVVAGVLFGGFILASGAPAWMLLVIVPGIALIALYGVRTTRFCDKCGAMVMSQAPFFRPKYCARCGSALDA